MTYHRTWSLVKSIFRIVGYLFLFYSVFDAVMLLITAEILGIFEEGGDQI